LSPPQSFFTLFFRKALVLAAPAILVYLATVPAATEPLFKDPDVLTALLAHKAALL
jgi:hypothetical protein